MKELSEFGGFVKTKVAASQMLLLGALLVLGTIPAHATFPGKNGQSTYVHTRHELRYRVIDLGTFGGHNSFTNGGSIVINSSGAVVGQAESAQSCPYLPDGVIAPPFKWQAGVMTELPRLQNGCGGFPLAINSYGLIVGLADTGVIDPLTGGPEVHAVVWKHDQIIDLGTLGGANSLAGSVNDRGQVVGVAQTADLDAFHFGGLIGLPATTQWRGFLWQGDAKQDLGTLGGSDSAVTGDLALNERGEIAGISFTDDIVNPLTGFPTLDSFLWKRGKKIDLGTLGGVFTDAFTINNRDQVVGFSDIAGDLEAHAFRWDRGRLRDLGTLGGTFSGGGWINDAGDVIGASTTVGDEAVRGFIWTHGVMTDLGTLDDDSCSDAFVINILGQVVGLSFTCGEDSSRGYVWKDGKMTDLNAFLPPGSELQLTAGKYINEWGMISASGIFPNGDEHAVILVPCFGNAAGCRSAREISGKSASKAVPLAASAIHPKLTHTDAIAGFRARRARRYTVTSHQQRPR